MMLWSALKTVTIPLARQWIWCLTVSRLMTGRRHWLKMGFKEILQHDAGSGFHLHIGNYQGRELVRAENQNTRQESVNPQSSYFVKTIIDAKDTYESLSKKYHISADQLKAANGGKDLAAGQALKIPVSGNMVRQATWFMRPGDEFKCVVENNATIWQMAKETYLPMQDIIKRNNVDPYKLQVGQELTLWSSQKPENNISRSQDISSLVNKLVYGGAASALALPGMGNAAKLVGVGMEVVNNNLQTGSSNLDANSSNELSSITRNEGKRGIRL